MVKNYKVLKDCIVLILVNKVCNIHMEAYEKGKLEKVYTIRDSDTTYKWTYREKN